MTLMNSQSCLLLVVGALFTLGCVLSPLTGAEAQDPKELTASLAKNSREIMLLYRKRADEADAKGQDGDAIRRECQRHFEAELYEERLMRYSYTSPSIQATSPLREQIYESQMLACRR